VENKKRTVGNISRYISFYNDVRTTYYPEKHAKNVKNPNREKKLIVRILE
jgi:hypothetical protein